MTSTKPHVKEWIAQARYLGFDTTRLEGHLTKVEAAWAKNKPGKTAYKDLGAAHAALIKEAVKRYDKLLEATEISMAEWLCSAAWTEYRKGIADGTLNYLAAAPPPLKTYRASYASEMAGMAEMTAPSWGNDALHQLAVLTAMTEKETHDVSHSELQQSPDGYG